MSVVRQITIGQDYKISKNYNSVGTNMSLTIDVFVDDDLDEVIKLGYEQIKKECMKQLKFKGE